MPARLSRAEKNRRAKKAKARTQPRLRLSAIKDIKDTDVGAGLSRRLQIKQLQALGWILVQSSNVGAIMRRGQELLVAFLNGAVYTWNDIDNKRYRGLLRTPSKGKYIHKFLSNKVHKYTSTTYIPK